MLNFWHVKTLFVLIHVLNLSLSAIKAFPVFIFVKKKRYVLIGPCAYKNEFSRLFLTTLSTVSADCPSFSVLVLSSSSCDHLPAAIFIRIWPNLYACVSFFFRISTNEFKTPEIKSFFHPPFLFFEIYYSKKTHPASWKIMEKLYLSM